ncbi:hypothetical protein SAMN02745975_03838 [Geosporobacter subterraneus DSM 17957]|uniref:Uncharacterized protein n=1 Tax=Geosporobacter subterraneus DSM 17957 TaxID=1121919 RepID=A0A1M6QG01_9FIRM|nr:hypothetical protein [Geosporobacter subterraneus]SHK18987.1 hypothetical protein SAMN02745975_03838 [Geosporobacter subterraneus DSM 17957]
MDGNDFLFSMVETADGSLVFITGKDIWEEEAVMSQGFDDNEMEILEPILYKAGLRELMDSCYEMTKPAEETKDILLEQGLMQDKNFDNYITREYD